MKFAARRTDRDRDIQAILHYLLNATRHDTVTFDALSKAINGVDVQRRHRYYLTRALELARRDHNVVFESVRNIGYIRMDDSRLVPFCSNSLDAVGRMVKRKDETITAIASCSNNMPNAVKLVMFATQGKLGVIKYMTEKRFKVEVPEKATRPPPLIETAYMFLEHIGAGERKVI